MNFREGWQKHAGAHVWWIIAILSVMVILLVSVRVGGNESIKDIINTSLALSSLVLALIAILQALISSNDLKETIAEVKSASASLSEPATKILEAASSLSDRSDYIAQSTRDLNERLDEININRSTESGLIQDHPLIDASVGASIAYYLCVRSFENRASFDVALINGPEIATGEYLMGYILGSIASIRSLHEMTINTVDTTIIVSNLGKHEYLLESPDDWYPKGFEDVRNIIDTYFGVPRDVPERNEK